MGRKFDNEKRINLIEKLESAGLITEDNRTVSRKDILSVDSDRNNSTWLTGNSEYRSVERGKYVVPFASAFTVAETPAVAETPVTSPSVEVEVDDSEIESADSEVEIVDSDDSDDSDDELYNDEGDEDYMISDEEIMNEINNL